MVDLFGAPLVEPPPPASQDIDMRVEPSGAETLTPRTNPNLIGQTSLEKELVERIQNNKMPHALILHGSKGIGKATLAFRLARFLLRRAPAQDETLFISPEEPVFRQVISGGHPDLLPVERLFDDKKGRLKNAVDIEQIRKIAPFMRMTSNTTDGWRVVIVDDADSMTVNAQNSLLKILEEPPKKAILILIVHRIGLLIPTIRSRCQALPLSALTDQNCKKIIQSLALEYTPTEEELFLDYCQGSPGLFTHIIEEGGEDCIQEFLSLLTSYPNFDPKMTHSFSEQYGKMGQEKSFALLHAYLLWLLQVSIKHKITAHKLPFFIADNTGYNTLCAQHSYRTLLELHDSIDALMKNAQHKALDKRNTLLQMFFLLQT